MLKENVVKKYDRSVPEVDFDNDDMIWQLVGLIGEDKNIYNYIGLLLLRLGFRPEEKILLYNYNKNDYTCDCDLNNEYCCKIKFDLMNNKIAVIGYDEIYEYDCEPSALSEVGMMISLGNYSYRYNDGLIFTRYLSRQGAKFIFSRNNYVIELALQKPDDIKLPLFENGIYAKYKLDGEEELVKYLSAVKIFDETIEDIYRKLSEVYLYDVSKYPEFSLKKSEVLEKGETRVTDLIVLRNGKLIKFGMTDAGKSVFLDQDDDWLYEMPIESNIPVKFSLSSQQDKITCIFSMTKEYNLKEYINQTLKVDINTAMEGVVDVKRRVRKLFNKNEGSK